MSDKADKRALITGITGQDGSYLAELLLEKGYEVHGIVRRSSSFNTHRIDHLYHDPHEQGVRLFTHYGDLTDATALVKLLYELQPDEIYNLGAQSHVRVSFDDPRVHRRRHRRWGRCGCWRRSGEAGVQPALLPGVLLGDVRRCAAAAERGHALPPAQPLRRRQGRRVLGDRQLPRGLRHVRRQRDPLQPRVPAPRRDLRHPQDHPGGRRIAAGLQEKLYLGNLDAQRDWGYAKEYVEAMWLMLQADEPDDFVIATGETHTVRDAVEIAFARAGLDGEEHVEIDPKYYRPSEVDVLLGDASKAKETLGWEPKVRFKELVELMVDADVAELEDQMAGKVTRYSHEGA